MANMNQSGAPLGTSIATVSANITSVSQNTDQKVVVTTEDKIELALRKHVAKLEQAKAWQTPLALALSILTTFASAQFVDNFGIPAATWRAVFLLALVLSVLWLLVAIRKARDAPSIDDLAESIRKQ